ncbi:SAV_915 family protein [Actinophytocola sp. NPDC049390]|uniref:SAV_915 family protein n=1 Tax=Actinophytocola sp. NPDC049390 TaxID=3363894 RepID=UPI00379BB9A8
MSLSESPSENGVHREGGALAPFDRRALRDLHEVAVDAEIDELLALALPDGDLELFITERNEQVLFCYTELRHLVTACGPGQPRLRVRLPHLVASAEAAGHPLFLALDTWHPAGVRYADPDVRELEPLPSADPVPPITRVWIPTRPVEPGSKEARPELHYVAADEPMLLGYQSLSDLLDSCGPYQAAVAVHPRDLDEIVRTTGAHGVLMDAVLDEDVRHSAPVVDWRREDPFSVDGDR